MYKDPEFGNCDTGIVKPGDKLRVRCEKCRGRGGTTFVGYEQEYVSCPRCGGKGFTIETHKAQAPPSPSLREQLGELWWKEQGWKEQAAQGLCDLERAIAEEEQDNG